MPGNKLTHGTKLGFSFTIFFVIFLLSHLYLKTMKFLGIDDSKLIINYQENYYDSSFVMSVEDGLQFAFGISAYDNNSEPIDDPAYGEVKARITTWGFNDTIGINVGEPLAVKPCSKEQLGLSGNSSDFWPISPSSQRDIAFYSKKFQCIDESYGIQGAYDSDKAQRLEFYFEKCDDSKRACATDE